jgi:hypothetical protein
MTRRRKKSAIATHGNPITKLKANFRFSAGPGRQLTSLKGLIIRSHSG